MVQDRTGFRRILTRSLAVMTMLCMYSSSFIGVSALLLGASSTSALARGGGRGGGGGFHGGGGFRGGGFGLGVYPGYYGGYYPYYEDEGVCYVVRQRVMTRYGWRIRRVNVCE